MNACEVLYVRGSKPIVNRTFLYHISICLCVHIAASLKEKKAQYHISNDDNEFSVWRRQNVQVCWRMRLAVLTHRAQAKNIEFSFVCATSGTRAIQTTYWTLLFGFCITFSGAQPTASQQQQQESREANSDQSEHFFSNYKANMYRDRTNTLVGNIHCQFRKLSMDLPGNMVVGILSNFTHTTCRLNHTACRCVCLIRTVYIYNVFMVSAAIGGSVCSIPSHDQASRGRYNLMFFVHTHSTAHCTVASQQRMLWIMRLCVSTMLMVFARCICTGVLYITLYIMIYRARACPCMVCVHNSRFHS